MIDMFMPWLEAGYAAEGEMSHMVTHVNIEYFKRFERQSFDLRPITMLAGPNNSGKSTLLQAVMVWNLAMQKWCEKKGPGSGSKAKDRQGVPITRSEFTALPLPSMDQLWTDTHTSLRKGEVEGKTAGSPRPLVISLTGKTAAGSDWRFGFEFRYSGPEQIHVKPVAADLDHLDTARQEVSVIYIPPFSGIGVNETRLDRDYQNMLIGQGKAGDILRNLLLEIEGGDAGTWTEIGDIIEKIFGYRLLAPVYSGTPFITCQYLKGVPSGIGKGGLSPLDISTTGSGFHQVLLILAFLFARPSSLILLDEPDAHLHVLLQKELYDLLLSLCNRRHGQLVIASHSEVLIESTSPQNIVSFYHKPHSLTQEFERDQIGLALKRVSSLDILMAENSPGILYLEGQTDFNLLKAWSKVLKHPTEEWFSKTPFWHDNNGCHPKEARSHFFALKSIKPDLKALLLLDGDNRNLPNRELAADKLEILRWGRYEAESYLLHPDALGRFIRSKVDDLYAVPALDYLRGQMPPAFFQDPLALIEYLRAAPASKTLIPEMLRRVDLDIEKNEYFLIAEQMLPEELPAEVSKNLDAIAAVVL